MLTHAHLHTKVYTYIYAFVCIICIYAFIGVCAYACFLHVQYILDRPIDNADHFDCIN